MLGRSELARREGYERSIAYSSVALSVIGCYLAAALTALVLAVVALIGGSICDALVACCVGRCTRHHGHPSRSESPHSRPDQSRPRTDIRGGDPELVPLSAPDRLVHSRMDPDRRRHDSGDKSLVAHPPIARVALAAVVSWIVGFITPSPGGIGVREAVFVAVAGVAAGPAAAAAILARVLFVLVDGTGAGVGWLVLRSHGAFECASKRRGSGRYER